MATGALAAPEVVIEELSQVTTTPTQRIYVTSIPDRRTFDAYSRTAGTERFAKFIIDIHSGAIYFIDVNTFRIHADFVLNVLLRQPWTEENLRLYNKNYERIKPRFILGYLTEHTVLARFSFGFWEGDKIDANSIARVQKNLSAAFFINDLAFRPMSPAQERIATKVARLGLKVVTSDQLYRAAPFQSFNAGVSVGRLRVVPTGTPYESLTFDRGDIVVLQESYPDISPVAGIITTVFSTPLSHVNLRAASWGIPNSGLRGAFSKYKRFDQKLVRYEVTPNGVSVRRATRAERTDYEHAKTARTTIVVPPADTTTRRMPMLSKIRASQANIFGSKTANLGEIAAATAPSVHVPRGFGVPFFYYAQHMHAHGLDKRVATLTADKRFGKDALWTKSELRILRKVITDARMSPKLLTALYRRTRRRLGGRGVFVRSSTNAEDLPGFNGAGLYDTVPNVRGKKALGAAVKTVWASLWNYRAVADRELFGIGHRDVYAAVLIQVGVNATAAGVLITENLFDPSDSDTFTINAMRGLGIRVVEGTRIPEQILYDTANGGTKIISRSNDALMLVFDERGGIREVPNSHQGVILTEARTKALSTAVLALWPLFNSIPLDVEWLIEGEKVWIVQARPYVRHRSQKK